MRVFGVDYQSGDLAVTTAVALSVRSASGNLRRGRHGWSRDGSLKGPSATETAVQCTPAQPGAVAPVLLTKRDAVQGEQSRARGVAHLLRECRPLAVAWLVASVVVDALQRQAGRALAHISDEVLERQPSLADGNASCSVVLKGMVALGSTARNHRAPNLVFERLRSAVSSHLSALPSWRRVVVLSECAHIRSRLASLRTEPFFVHLPEYALAVLGFACRQATYLLSYCGSYNCYQFLDEALNVFGFRLGSETICHDEIITQVRA